MPMTILIKCKNRMLKKKVAVVLNTSSSDYQIKQSANGGTQTLRPF